MNNPREKRKEIRGTPVLKRARETGRVSIFTGSGPAKITGCTAFLVGMPSDKHGVKVT